MNAVSRALDATVGRAARGILIGAIIAYRRVVSPLLGPSCRYYPSCSTYALEAVRVHGAAKGSLLATARLCRCHPWTPGGVDPVPPRGAWKPEPYVPLERYVDGRPVLDADTEPVGDDGDLTRPVPHDPDRPDQDRSAA